MHPSVGVAAHGVASVNGAGEGGGVSHCNPCESGCDLHLRWYCVGKEQNNRNTTTVNMTRSRYGSSVQCMQKNQILLLYGLYCNVVLWFQVH